MTSSKLCISRERGRMVDVRRSYRVLVDGVDQAKVVPGETIEIAVAPGEHQLQIRIDWSGSAIRSFSIADAERTEFTCRPAFHPLLAFPKLIQSIWNHEAWVALEPKSPDS